MRIWSLHPKYLDSKGLVALWRETLLAKKVILGGTQAYKNHPQMIRFYESEGPVKAINYNLFQVWEEASKRSYKFDEKKFEYSEEIENIQLTSGQLQYEVKHLLNKLKTRDIKRYKAFKEIDLFEAHPLFNLIDGKIETWEKLP